VWVEDDWSGGSGHRLRPPDRRRASGYHQADMEQQPPQRVRRRAVQGPARPSRSAPGTGHVVGAGRDRIAPSSCGKTPTTMYLASLGFSRLSWQGSSDVIGSSGWLARDSSTNGPGARGSRTGLARQCVRADALRHGARRTGGAEDEATTAPSLPDLPFPGCGRAKLRRGTSEPVSDVAA
jgi:hypothetical protein